MLKRFFVLLLSLGGFILFYILIEQYYSPLPEKKSYGIIEHKINSPHFPAYKWCTWEWKNFDNIGLWIQNCIVKEKKLTLDSVSRSLPLFYSISGKQDTLALELFDSFDLSYSEDAILDSVYMKLLQSWFLKIESLCYFEKVIQNDFKIYRLVSKNKALNCWDYGTNDMKDTFFIIKKHNSGKIIFFINQMQKKLFDVQSLHIYE